MNIIFNRRLMISRNKKRQLRIALLNIFFQSTRTDQNSSLIFNVPFDPAN